MVPVARFLRRLQRSWRKELIWKLRCATRRASSAARLRQPIALPSATVTGQSITFIGSIEVAENRLLAHFRLYPHLPEIPDAVDHGEIDGVGLGAFLGAQISDLAAEPDRLRLQARIDVGVVGAEYRDLDVG